MQTCAALIETEEDRNSLVDDAGAEVADRKLLDVVAEEPASRDRTCDLIAEPPGELQRSIAAATAAAVVVGALILWLQAKVDIAVMREGSQGAGDPKLIGDVVATVPRLVHT